jgi:hypothetical protein
VAKIDTPAGDNHRTLKRLLFGGLCLIVLYIFLGSFKVIYVNLQNTDAAKLNLYNPISDLLTAAISSILLGFVLGYWLKSKR